MCPRAHPVTLRGVRADAKEASLPAYPLENLPEKAPLNLMLYK